jgi:hypothetical protein
LKLEVGREAFFTGRVQCFRNLSPGFRPHLFEGNLLLVDASGGVEARVRGFLPVGLAALLPAWLKPSLGVRWQGEPFVKLTLADPERERG